MLTSKLRWLSSATAGAPGDVWRMVADEYGLGWLGGLPIGAGNTTGAAEKAGSRTLTAERLETELANGLADDVGAAVRSAAGPRSAMSPQECKPMTAAATRTTLTALAATRADWRRCPPTSANSSSGIATSCGRPGKRRSGPFGCQTRSPTCRPHYAADRRETPHAETRTHRSNRATQRQMR